MTDDSLRERFESKVFYCTVTGCHLWGGTWFRLGYGQFKVRERTRSAHRVAYELYVGPIPEGLVLDHVCRTRPCVNPDHLRAVTQDENMHAPGCKAGWNNSTKTHCPRGHEYTEENTYSHAGRRHCRTCKRERQRVKT